MNLFINSWRNRASPPARARVLNVLLIDDRLAEQHVARLLDLGRGLDLEAPVT